MSKKRLLRKIDAEAKAETEARKAADLEAGKYSIDPNTGKSLVTPENQTTVKQQTVETVNTPGFENTSLVTTGENNGKKLTQAGDVIEQNKITAQSVDSPFVSKRYEATGLAKLTPGEIDASVLDYQSTVGNKELMEENIKVSHDQAANDAYNNGDNQTADAIKENKLATLNDAANLGNQSLEDSQDMFPALKKTMEQIEMGDNEVQINRADIEKAANQLDEELMYSQSPETQEKLKLFQKLVNSGRISTSEPAIEKLGLTDYYPDIQQPLQVGTYSGSIVGSNPIFTAKGVVFPQGVYDARKRALQNEAIKRKQQQQKLLEMASVNAAPQYKQDLDSLQFSNISNAISSVKGNVDKLFDLNNPESKKFWADKNKIDNVGNQTLWIQGRFNDMLKMMHDPKVTIPSSIQRVMNEWASGGYFNAQDVINDPKKIKELNSIYNRMKDYDNMTYYVSQNIERIDKDTVPLAVDLTKKISELPAEKYQQLVKKIGMGDNDAYISAIKEFVPDSRLMGFIDGMYNQHDFSVSKDEFAKYVWSHLGEKIMPKVDIRSNKNFDYWKENQRKKEREKDLIFENYKINTNTTDNKIKLYNAAINGNFKTTLKAMTGLGDVKENKSGAIYQDFKSPGLEGKKGQTSLGNLTTVNIGGKVFTPAQASNFFGKYKDAIQPEIDEASGKQTGWKYNESIAEMTGLPPLNDQEIAFAKYYNAMGGTENLGLNTQFRGGKVFQKYRTADGKYIGMREEDFKDQNKVSNAAPWGQMDVDLGYYDKSGNFISVGSGISSGNLDNDATRAAYDNFLKGENTQYKLQPGITEGGTGNEFEESSMVVTDEDIYD